MFTIDQIKAAHSKVKSGADFPAYVQDIKRLGVIYYETYVADGHTDYHGANDYKSSSPAKYDSLKVADTADTAQLKLDLKTHQEGRSDFMTFCRAAASLGVDKWAVSIERMTCSYFDKRGQVMLVEDIPVMK